ncbi:MAG: hypothetical protein ACTHN5_08530 [Phycisphaerae bacterium]
MQRACGDAVEKIVHAGEGSGDREGNIPTKAGGLGEFDQSAARSQSERFPGDVLFLKLQPESTCFLGNDVADQLKKILAVAAVQLEDVSVVVREVGETISERLKQRGAVGQRFKGLGEVEQVGEVLWRKPFGVSGRGDIDPHEVAALAVDVLARESANALGRGIDEVEPGFVTFDVQVAICDE